MRLRHNSVGVLPPSATGCSGTISSQLCPLPRWQGACTHPHCLLMWTIKSTSLLEYPHSLSYQAISLTKWSFKAMPALTSKTEEALQDVKSVETTSSSVQS